MSSFLNDVEIRHTDAGVELHYEDLIIRHLTSTDIPELKKCGSRVPVSIGESDLEANGVPKDYSLRPGLYNQSLVSVATVNGKVVGASGLCAKTITLHKKPFDVCYGIDGIVHPDFRSKGYLSLLSVRNSIVAAEEGLKVQGAYGSLTSTNTPSYRACLKSNMQKVFQYDRLISCSKVWPYYMNSKPSTDDIKLVKDPSAAATLLFDQFSTFDFFPRNTEEMTKNVPFLGTLLLQSEKGDKSAMVSLWDMGYTSTTYDIKTNEERHCFFLFGGAGDEEVLVELLKRVGAWAHRQSQYPCLVINTSSSYDPLARAFYRVVPIEDIKGVSYLIMFGDRTKNKEISYSFDTSNQMGGSIPKTKTKEEELETLFAPEANLISAPDACPETLYTFFDPRDNGILLIPQLNVIQSPYEFATAPLLAQSLRSRM